MRSMDRPSDDTYVRTGRYHGRNELIWRRETLVASLPLVGVWSLRRWWLFDDVGRERHGEADATYEGVDGIYRQGDDQYAGLPELNGSEVSREKLS